MLIGTKNIKPKTKIKFAPSKNVKLGLGHFETIFCNSISTHFGLGIFKNLVLKIILVLV